MADVSLPWGPGELEVQLPPQWKLQQLARPALQSAEKDWPDRLAAALNQPSSGPALAKLVAGRRKGRVVLIVEDITRHSRLSDILPVILRELRHGGLSDQQIEIFIATGMHPAMTPGQVAEKLGPAAEALQWRCNPWTDKSAYVSLGKVGGIDVRIDRGVAAADLRIIISSVSPHLQAGFGGGYKMLLPGCAALDTIRSLHRLGLDRTPRQLVGTDAANNPMRAAIDRGGQLIDDAGGASFAVQYLLDDQNRPTDIATGQVAATQQMMSKKCSVSCGVVMESPADVVITNAHPRDFDLWQCFKAIANTIWAVRPNGVVICTARCEGGLRGVKPIPWPLSPSRTRRLVQALGAEAIASLLTRLVPRLGGDAAFFVRMGLRTIHRNPIFLVSPNLCEQVSRFPGLEFFADVSDAIAAADAFLGGGQQRVTVFPAGGISFPIAGTAAGVRKVAK